MSNLFFANELTFGEGSSVYGVSALNVGGVSTSSSKILFNGVANPTTETSTISVINNGLEYELLVSNSYNGQKMSVINENRLSTQFTVVTADTGSFMTLSSVGYSSISPTLQKLHHLGYV